MDTNNWKEIKTEWKEYRQNRAVKRMVFIYALSESLRFNIKKITDYQYRLTGNEIGIDYYPQRGKIHVLSSNKRPYVSDENLEMFLTGFFKN